MEWRKGSSCVTKDDCTNISYKCCRSGSIFTFEIKGDAQTAQKFIDNLAIFSLLANVADVKSLVIHPATTTHSQCTEEELLDQGIKPNTIRLSIGIEKVEDLIAAHSPVMDDEQLLPVDV